MLDAAERALAPLDRARAALMGVALRVEPAAFLVRRRDARVLARSLSGILVAFVLAVVAPGALLVLSPLVFGVPHVGADVRYLVRRQRLARGVEIGFYVACAALLALRVSEMIAPLALPYARVELAAGAAWIALAALAASQDHASRARAAGVVFVTGGLLLFAWSRPDVARLVFAHVHNLVGVLLWVVLFAGRRRAALVPLALLALLLAVILAGATLPYVVRFHGYELLGVDVFFAADQLAPHVGGLLGPSLVLSYAFLQSVHYMAWLAWIPDSAHRSQGTLTFRMTAKSLLRDLGSVGLGLIALATVAVLGAAFFDAGRTRTAYLTLSAFHGYLELAAAAYLFVRVRTRAPSAGLSPLASTWSASG